jgi:hypothetical protein
MERRTFLALVPWSLLAAPLAAEGQEPPKVHRVGVLSVPPAYFAAFEEGLRQLGYIRGQNILFETPSLGPTDSRAGAAEELARRNVEVIVTGPDRFIDAAKQATTTIPIVMVYGSDPVGRGYIKSLARPGGNIERPTALRSTVTSRSTTSRSAQRAMSPRHLALLSAGVAGPFSSSEGRLYGRIGVRSQTSPGRIGCPPCIDIERARKQVASCLTARA